MSNPSIVQNPKVTEPNLSDLLGLLKKDILLSLFCHAIGTVQSFDSAKQTVTATINYKKTYLRQDQAGQFNPVLVDYPILLDVPVVILGGGNANLTFPIAQGDECLILFNDRDIDNWFQSGQVGPVASNRLHSFSDGFALIGVRSLARSLAGYDTSRAVLANGTTLVGVSASKVKIANALHTLNGLLQSLISQIQLITVSGVTTGPGVSGPPVNAAALAAIATQIGTLLE